MNKSEKEIKRQLEGEGWKVLRGGAPDFIALRVEDGKIIDCKGIEVKSKNGKLSYEQSIYRMIFKDAGIPFEVVINPDQTTPARTKPDHFNPDQPMSDHANPTLSNPRLGRA